MKFFKNVEVIRSNNDNIEIRWKDENIKNVSIFYLDGNEEFYMCRSKKDSKAVFKDPDVKHRKIFILKAEEYENFYVGERLVHLKGTSNCRDLGGYKTKDGRRVKWNTFFRSDSLSLLSEEDEVILEQLGIKTIFDFRSASEVKINPDVKIKGAKYINISGLKTLNRISDNFDMTSIYNEVLENLEESKFMLNSYKMMPFDNLAFKEFFQAIENCYSVPILFHCSAGKDRTGVAAALLLSILGVPEETILKDYLLTNTYRKETNEKILKKIALKVQNKEKIELVKEMFFAEQEYIETAFNEIKRRYGNVECYLEKEYGVTKKKRKELKNRYLY